MRTSEMVVRKVNGEEILNWIFEHDTLAVDFLRHFGLDEKLQQEGTIVIATSEVDDFVIEKDDIRW